MSKLQFGWSEVDITPKQKISLAGEFFERVTDEVETPLTITALAIKSGDDSGEVPPVLIPNTEVKLTSADNT